jgi:hypothetical protein
MSKKMKVRSVVSGKSLAMVCTASVLFLASSAKASLVTNGSFETTTSGGGQLGFNTNATGWTTTGYNFVYAPGTADTSGVTGVYGNVQLWGPGNGSLNGLTVSPSGGNFVAADGSFEVGAISQTISGLTAGASYTVSFYFAGAQAFGYSDSTTEQWNVSFGGQTQSTPVLSNASHGFTGWQQDTMTFVADNTSDVLSFLAVGTPDGLPPFVLLDGVSVNAASAAPEPVTGALMIAGLLVGAGLIRAKK